MHIATALLGRTMRGRPPALLAFLVVAFTILLIGPLAAQLGPAPLGSQPLPGAGALDMRTKLPIAGATARRTLTSKLGDQLSILDFGGVCDGTTDDSAAILAAGASGRRIVVPGGLICNAPSVANPPAGVFVGPGQIRTSDGTLRAPLVTSLAAPVAVRLNLGSPAQSFSGSVGSIGMAHEHTVTGAATLHQPASGYDLNPEASMDLDVLNVQPSAGWNANPGDNAGRSGVSAHYTRINHYGQGDAGGYTCDAIVAQNRISLGLPVTNYLANPAIGCFGGQMNAFAQGDYMTGFGDLDLNDNGNDAAAAGSVLNFNRSMATEAIGDNWVADIRQSIGAQPLDAAYRMSGPTAIGTDYSGAGLTTYRLDQFYPGAAGTGYKVGDVVTAAGGVSLTPTAWKIAAVNASGGITGLTLVNAGLYLTPPVVGFTTIALTGGSGTGATASGGYGNMAGTVYPPTGGCASLAAAPANGVTGVLIGTTVSCVTPEGAVSGDRVGFQQLVSPTLGLIERYFGTTIAAIDLHGHQSSMGGTPTVSGCGTSTVEPGSSDMAGAIDFSGAPTVCTLVFANSFVTSPAGHPFCTLTAKGSAASFIEEGDTATTLVLARSDFAAMTNSVNYRC